MDKNDPPRTFGVFKPSGHTVIAFKDEASMLGAIDRLVESGVSDTTMTTYTPAQMLAQTDDDVRNAGVLASIGQELNLVKVHHELAQRGSYFMVVQTDSDEQAEQATAVARQFGARMAQRYGKFMIEELIDPADGQQQVFESPDRGLDDRNIR